MASTFFCTSRSMPAMPMALSSPPMVVGIRHTSSAMSTVGEKSTPENLPKGSSVMQTSRKMMVSAESRIVSAISLGVFWRLAPSTRPIMRSRKLSPGLAEMRTLISSLSTLRAPVTLERSPPASRMTGALSPVMALSSTVAAPSMISPSPGMASPATMSTTSPLRSWSAETCSVLPLSRTRLAVVWVRLARRVLACALPRPSAMASAKLAKSTVNHSQTVIWPVNARLSCEANTSMVVTSAPTSVTNITGLRTIVTGLSFLKASPSAGTMILGSKMERD